VTDQRIERIAVAMIALLFVGFSALGAAIHSTPWLIVGGWFGVALVVHVTRKG
jgi:hypothetical protein